MLAGRYFAGNDRAASEVEPMCSVRWRGHDSLSFENAFTLDPNTYGDTVNDVIPVVAADWLAGLLENEDNRNMGDIPLSRNAEVRACLHVTFTAIETGSRKMSLAFTVEAGDVFGLTLRGLEALQESEEKRTCVLV